MSATLAETMCRICGVIAEGQAVSDCSTELSRRPVKAAVASVFEVLYDILDFESIGRKAGMGDGTVPLEKPAHTITLEIQIFSNLACNTSYCSAVTGKARSVISKR